MTTKAPQPAAYERSDVCAVPAASVIVENVVAFEIAAAVVEKYVGTSLAAIKAAHDALHDLARDHLAQWGATEGAPRHSGDPVSPSAFLDGPGRRPTSGTFGSGAGVGAHPTRATGSTRAYHFASGRPRIQSEISSRALGSTSVETRGGIWPVPRREIRW